MKKKIVNICLLLAAVSCFQSCKKDCDPAVPLLPPLVAVQKIREAPIPNWEPDKKFIEKKEIGFSEPLKQELLNFKTDSNIIVACRVKIKNNPEEVLLPNTIVNAAGEMQNYFYTVEKDKIILFCYNSGTSPAMPMESLSLNFTKITI